MNLGIFDSFRLARSSSHPGFDWTRGAKHGECSAPRRCSETSWGVPSALNRKSIRTRIDALLRHFSRLNSSLEEQCLGVR